MHRVLLTLLLAPLWVFSQSVSVRMGARAAGMGSAGLVLADESSLFQNIGGLASQRQSSVFFASETAPTLPSANRMAAAFSLPLKFGVLSAGAFRFGDDVYSEQLLIAGFAHQLETTSLGIRANMIQYRADGFGTRTAFTVDVAGLTRITPEWTVGAGILNINQADIAAGEPLPVILAAAIGWHAPDGPLLSIETEKVADAPLRVRGGIEMELKKKVLVRTGFSLQPLTITGGVGVKTYRIRLDFASTYHSSFSFLHQASAAYLLGNPPRS